MITLWLIHRLKIVWEKNLGRKYKRLLRAVLNKFSKLYPKKLLLYDYLIPIS